LAFLFPDYDSQVKGTAAFRIYLIFFYENSMSTTNHRIHKKAGGLLMAEPAAQAERL
jgi:hypothetical protein